MKRLGLATALAVLVTFSALGTAQASSHSVVTSPGDVVYSDVLELRGTYSGATPLTTTGFGFKSTCEPGEGVIVNGTASTSGASNVITGGSLVLAGPTWNGTDFAVDIDISGMEPGSYCFAFNPGPNQADARVEHPFWIADAEVSGGGQILEEDYKVSFSGEAYRVESGGDADGVGYWTVTFHNVSNNSLDKATFTGDTVSKMNLFPPHDIANLQVAGSLDGVSGYRLVVRAEDAGEPGTGDTVRFELWNGGSLVYDTYFSGDFPGESSIEGSARTTLDRGNIEISSVP